MEEESTADFINTFFINVGNVAGGTYARILGSGSGVGDALLGLDCETEEVEEVNETLMEVRESEVYNVTKTINTAKLPGTDLDKDMNWVVVKEAFKVLRCPLTHLYNISPKKGIFPDSWKIAMVVPIPKGGDPSQVSNLRPISLLPQPGKVLEKLVHGHLVSYLEDQNLLSRYQYGFQRNRSTIGVIYKLLERVNLNMDRRIPTLVTYIDFRKAFDCVQFDTLLDKPDLGEGILKWIRNYLVNRQQKVIANGITSTVLDIKQGVPQGSILGPLLYLIYADDLHAIIKICGYAFYADDTVVYSTHSNFEKSKKIMKRNLSAINQWCATNGIYMNVAKTKYMIFGTRCTLAKIKDFKLTVGGIELERVLTYSYLGMTLDPSLNFDKHVNKLVARATNKVKQLKKMRNFLTTEAAMLVYTNMIMPILEYGDVFLTAASKENRDKCQIVQNKALRIVHRVYNLYGTDLMHKESKLLKLKHRRVQHLLNFMHSKRDEQGLGRARRRSGVRTRASYKRNFVLRKPNTEKYKRCASYVGAKLWNNLSSSVQKLENKVMYKTKILTHVNMMIRDTLAQAQT